MDKVNRYSCSEQWHGMSPDDDGDFVRHADYAALQARIAELEARNAASERDATDEQCRAMIDAYEDAMDGQRLPDGDSYDYEVVRAMYRAAIDAHAQGQPGDEGRDE